MRFLGGALALFLCWATLGAGAQATEHSNEDMLLQRLEDWQLAEPARLDSAGLDSFIDSTMQWHHIPGVAAAIVKDGCSELPVTNALPPTIYRLRTSCDLRSLSTTELAGSFPILVVPIW